MRLTAYRLGCHAHPIRPAASRRGWMDQTTSRFAYRCLPLTMGNQFGWEVLTPCTFDALWTGGPGVDSIQVVLLGGSGALLPVSHFGHGILTFQPSYLFRTEAPYGMYVTGPLNDPRDGIAPLSAFVETDWLPFTFTMNWVFTRPGVAVRFEEGEPFCHFFPMSPAVLQDTEPEIRDLDEDPELARTYREWRVQRDRWNEEMRVPGTRAHEEEWQRFYHRGLIHTGEDGGAARHQTRLRVCPFHAAAPPAAAAGTGP
jgi:hypothetical protein